MALIIEDGSLVVGANSYVTIAEAIEYATLRREPFPTDELEVEGLLHNAMDYIEAKRRQFSGQKVSPNQSTQFPRVNCYVDGELLVYTLIPRELKQAQCQLAVDNYNVGDLMPTTSGYAVAKERVDVIEVEYATGGRGAGSSTAAEPEFPKADALLSTLFAEGAWLKTVRA